MLVSFCIIAYNEEENLPSLFKDIVSQTYPHELMEIILVNAMSADNTRGLMTDFSKQTHGFHNIIVCDNPRKTQPSGWNTAIKAASGDIIIRIDAHSHIPSDFVLKNIECQLSGEFITGGPRPNIIVDKTSWKETLLLAESSMFGSSIAAYRRETSERTYVNTMFHAAYRREVFDKAGLFNENLIRTEDNELHYRMREAGYKFCFDPAITSYQYTRNSLGKMLRQKLLNGYWIGLTAFVCPKCLSLFHFIPFAFITAIILTSILACLNLPLLSILMWTGYWLVNLGISIVTICLPFFKANSMENKMSITNLALPILFFLLHLSYGIGTLWGIIKYPFFRKTLRKEL